MSVMLKPGREKALHRRHPWIFSGAIAHFPHFENGAVLSVHSSKGEFVAKAFFHEKKSLCGRILSFTDTPIEEVLERKIIEAKALRAHLSDTNAYRLINAEGDGLPGLIVDVYDGVCVVQISLLGMEKLKPLILPLLKKHIAPKGIYEKSFSMMRVSEGLEESGGIVEGNVPDEIEIEENGLKYIVSVSAGQKTGFFLDQREMRKKIYSLSKGKRVLNCFSYSGGFSLAALKGGAAHVTSVDSSAHATALCERNTALNGFSYQRHTILKEEAFSFLKQDPLDYDLIILDPPSFAKSRRNIQKACRGYVELNRHAFRKAPAHSILLTCSCTGLVTPELFQDVVAQAASAERRNAKIISHHIDAPDHPQLLFHPEGRYLKSLLLFLDSR